MKKYIIRREKFQSKRKENWDIAWFLCRSTFIQNGYLHTKTEYSFYHLFSSKFLALFVTHFSFSTKRSCVEQKGRCPRRMLRMRLGRIVCRFCGQGEKHPLLPGEVLPPWATLPRP
ncbi:hypothetical protein BREVNS_0831 [Brevinematales bacterium NS]|nr:hypothetical protein BREVNS_0831 [Brevinematales bacterium NS]